MGAGSGSEAKVWTWSALGRRPVLFPVCSLLAGVAWTPTTWWVAGLACGAALGFAAWWSPRVGAHLALLAGAFWLGALAGALGFEWGSPVPPGLHRLEGEVEGPQRTADGLTWTVRTSAVDGQPARNRVQLSSTGPEVFDGQRVLVEAKVKPLVPAANDGEWSRAVALARRGVVGTAGYAEQHLVQLSEPSGVERWLNRARSALGRDTRALIDDADAANLVLTLAAGERASMGDDMEELFARSGLAHVLSVSGLHVAVVALSVFAALRWLLTRRQVLLVRVRDARSLAAPAAIPLVWSYVMFTGWQPPAVRSAIMCSLLLAGDVVRRRSDPLNAALVALLLMTLTDPSTPFDLSVQLSFVAVIATVVLSPTLRTLIPLPLPDPVQQQGWRLRLARWGEAVLQTTCASVAVTLGTAPLVLGAFQRVSLAGIPANIATMPLAGLLTMLSAGGAALHLGLRPLSIPVLWAAGQVARAFLLIADLFSRMPGAVWSLPAPSGVWSACWWAGLLIFVLVRGRWRLGALLAPGALLVVLASALTPRDRLDVTFLSVGHGDAIVLTSGTHAALIDGGGVPNGHDTGRRFVLPFLRQKMVRSLDLVALSHAHPDHALGLASVLEELPTRRLWLPADVGQGPLVAAILDAATGAEATEVEAGDPGMDLGAAHLDILGPPRDRGTLQTENDRSLVLRVRHGGVTFLLTGDLEAPGEAFLDPGQVTVMKAPHHGSNTSSTPELVERAHPRFVVFCVGANNHFRFPRPEIVSRYEALGAQCFRTDVQGAITFHSDGASVTVETHPPAPLATGRNVAALPRPTTEEDAPFGAQAESTRWSAPARRLRPTGTR